LFISHFVILRENDLYFVVISIVFSDPFLHNIYASIYGSSLTSVFIMETYSFCLTKCLFSVNQSYASKYKTSPLSMSFISAFAIQIILDKILPFIATESQFYIAKYFVAVINFFLIVPLVTILSSKNTFNFFRQTLTLTLSCSSNNQILPIDCNV